MPVLQIAEIAFFACCLFALRDASLRVAFLRVGSLRDAFLRVAF